MAERQAGGKLGFVDSLARLFRSKEEEPQAPKAQAKPAAPSRFDALRADFEAAVRSIDEKVAQHVRTQAAAGGGAGGTSAEDRARMELQRTEAAHRAVREDIVKMHERLVTGIANEDLDALGAFLDELEALSQAGKDSREILPRARYTISERLRGEAGALAVARLVALLQREKIGWPDPTRFRASATPEEIERSRRRRLAEIRESFLAQGFGRTGERMLGVVRTWGSDYPDRGSALWEETVLEGVAAGIRAQLLKEFVELLRRSPDALMSRTEELMGKELAALRETLARGGLSGEQANQAVAASLRVLDQVIPDLAWEQVRSQLPRARGEWSS
jgi:hypothetical protein